MARKYNYIYQSLVDDKSDIYGHFAYNAYKLEKIRFIEDFKSEHGKAPTDTELDTFHQKSLSRISEYKAIGKESADTMIRNLINDQIVKIQADCLSKIEGSVKAAFEAQPKPPKEKVFWKNVWASFVGALLVAAVPFILAFVCLLFYPEPTKHFLQEIMRIN